MKNSKVVPYLLLFYTIFIAAIFAIAEPTFIKSANLLNIIGTIVVLCIASIGESLVLITGEVDFACGAELAAGGCLVTALSRSGIPYILAVIITLAYCAMLGFINGKLHTKIGIPAFIATMGMSYVITGLTRLYTNNGNIYAKNKAFKVLGQSRIAGIPVSVLVLIVIAALALLYTEKMTSGRRLYAVGANSEACRYVGIDAKKEKMKSFVLCALLCGFAGIINSSQIASGNPGMGDTVLTNVLTILMLGASFYKLGVFNVPGTIVAAILVGVITNGMVLLGSTTWQQYSVKGILMIVAVTFITLGRRKSQKKISKI